MRLATLFIIGIATSLSAQAQPGWLKVGPDMPFKVFYSVWFTDADNGVAVGDTGMIRITTDGGGNWRTVPSGTQARLNRVRFTSKTLGFAAGNDGVLLRTRDGGNSWSKIDTKQTGVIYDVIFFDESNGMIGGYAGLCKTTSDSGRTWTNRDIGFGPNNVYSFTFLNTKKGWACGNAGNVGRTTNGGLTWQGQNSGKPGTLYSISFGNDSSGTIVGIGGLILHSTNGGRNWAVQFADVPLSSYTLNEVQHIDANRAYIAGWYGLILFTTNGGAKWSVQDVPSQSFLESVYFLDAQKGFAVGWDGLIIKTVSSGLLSADPARQPALFSLSKLYPNPVSLAKNSIVSVDFRLEEAGDVKLTAWNALGREVASVAEGFYEAGAWTVRWQPGDLPSGAYYLRLQTASGTAVQTVRLIR
ncbi:MAG: T9SS type A sorting domain-containing protein [Ignavibacteria bacterium]|nr:T9SS type A sorting domain-containing protein [Ignavibacteria bacterium]